MNRLVISSNFKYLVVDTGYTGILLHINKLDYIKYEFDNDFRDFVLIKIFYIIFNSRRLSKP